MRSTLPLFVAAFASLLIAVAVFVVVVVDAQPQRGLRDGEASDKSKERVDPDAILRYFEDSELIQPPRHIALRFLKPARADLESCIAANSRLTSSTDSLINMDGLEKLAAGNPPPSKEQIIADCCATWKNNVLAQRFRKAGFAVPSDLSDYGC